MIPAQAVPWPKSSVCGSVSKTISPVLNQDGHVFDPTADRRVVRVDPAVDDGHLDPGARAPLPGPLARQLLERSDPLDAREAVVRERCRPGRLRAHA